MIHKMDADLTSPEIPESDMKWIRNRLLITYIKLKTLARDEINFELMPEFKGVYETLKWTLKDLDLNTTTVEGSTNLAEVVDWNAT